MRPGTVKVRIGAAGICGTDLFLYQHAPVRRDAVHPITGETGPLVLGHEMSGHVVEVASDVAGISVGELCDATTSSRYPFNPPLNTSLSSPATI